MIGGDPPAPSNQLTSSLSSSPLAPSFTLFHFSLINLHRILTPGLSSSSVIDSNGRREERKKFRREFRFRAARSNLRYSMSNLQSSSKLHSNFITVYQQNGWSPSKQMWACAKLPLTHESPTFTNDLTFRHFGDSVAVDSIPRLFRSILAEPVLWSSTCACMQCTKILCTPSLDQDVTKSQAQTNKLEKKNYKHRMNAVQ